jgi:hypothetical protein
MSISELTSTASDLFDKMDEIFETIHSILRKRTMEFKEIDKNQDPFFNTIIMVKRKPELYLQSHSKSHSKSVAVHDKWIIQMTNLFEKVWQARQPVCHFQKSLGTEAEDLDKGLEEALNIVKAEDFFIPTRHQVLCGTLYIIIY